MGGSSSKIALGKILVKERKSTAENPSIFDVLADYDVDTKNVETGPESIEVEVYSNGSFETRKQAWIDAFQKAVDRQAYIFGVEIDCRFVADIGDSRAYIEAWNQLIKTNLHNRLRIQIHFRSVDDSQLEGIAKFINHFNDQVNSGTRFSFEISRLYKD